MTDQSYDASDFHGLFVPHAAADRAGNVRPVGKPAPNADFQRLKDLAIMLADPRPGTKLLEIGCGYGANLVPCALQGAEVYGQDLSSQSIARARRHFEHFDLDADLREGDATELQFEDNRFDVVLSSDFHEHLTDSQQRAVLGQAHRVLKPGSKLVLKTPNLKYLKTSLWFKRLRAILHLRSPFGYVIPHTAGTWDPEHVGLLTRWRLTRQLIDVGFLNYRFVYAPLRRLGASPLVEVLSTETPFVRDFFCEDLFVLAYKPITSSHFPAPKV